MKWLVRNEKKEYQLNVSSYSALFVNHTTNTMNIIKPVIDYFKPRTKMKDVLSIADIMQDYDDITHHSFNAIELSRSLLESEIALGTKTVLKSQLRKSLAINVETDGYLFTINTLIRDMVKNTVSELKIDVNEFTIDTLIKSLQLNLTLDEGSPEKNIILYKYKTLLPVIMEYIKKELHGSPILFFMYPEDGLSLKEQLELKNLFAEAAKEIQIFVITASKLFLADDWDGNNYFCNSKQLLTDSLLDELEWNSPLPYDNVELLESLMSILRNSVDLFEINPVVSNYKQADLVLFQSIDLYVFVFIMQKLKYKFTLDLNPETIDIPVFDYVMDIYEKL